MPSLPLKGEEFIKLDAIPEEFRAVQSQSVPWTSREDIG